MSDAEQAKGQVAEARRFARKFGLTHITVIIDYNELQISGSVHEIMPVNIKGNYLSDGWDVMEINGHDHQAIYRALRESLRSERPMAIIARITRASMLDVIRQNYVVTARAKGLKESAVILKHALRNAAIPIITVGGLQLGTLFGGAVITETVFAWPGMGRLLVNSVLARDYPVVQGIVLLLAITVVAVNLLVDLTYALLNPRIHLR